MSAKRLRGKCIMPPDLGIIGRKPCYLGKVRIMTNKVRSLLNYLSHAQYDCRLRVSYNRLNALALGSIIGEPRRGHRHSDHTRKHTGHERFDEFEPRGIEKHGSLAGITICNKPTSQALSTISQLLMREGEARYFTLVQISQ